MEWIVENWFLIVVLVACIIAVGLAVYRFTGLPTEKQTKKVKEWLLYAVTMAEKELGGGTGKLKLRYVYDWFLAVFPWLVKMISFEMFSALVDEALEEMREMLKTNEAVKELISNENITSGN